jgi:hypothetical protein
VTDEHDPANLEESRDSHPAGAGAVNEAMPHGPVELEGWYTIAELSELIGGSDRLYRDEIADRKLPAIWVGQWRIRGGDALEWAAARGERRRARRSLPSAVEQAHGIPSALSTEGG